MLSNTSNSHLLTLRTVIAIASFASSFFFVVAYTAFAQETAQVDTGGPVVELLAEIVYPVALAIGGLFVGIGGFTLDIAIQQLIINMGGMWNGPFGLGVIEVWKVIRDLFNILFIFGFIFIGIKTILNSEDSNTRRALGHLIIAAIFINFSLLIAQVIIDFSNVAATQIYNMATSGITIVDAGNATTGSPSITMAFMDTVSLGSFFDAKPENIKGAQLIIYSILMMIFFIIAGIIFLFAAYHVIYRFVALILYMIASPVLFLGLILPNFKGYTDKWVGGLLRQSFFAPAFLFLTYVALLSIDRLKGAFGIEGGDDGFPSIMDGADMTTSGFMIFVFFGIGVGFLYAAVKVGDVLGISGAKTALNVLNGARKGVQGMMYRNTVGRGLRMGMSQLDKLDQAAEGKSRFHPANITRSIIGGENTRRAMEKASNYGAGGQGLADAEKRDKERTQRATRATQVGRLSDAIKAGVGAPSGSTERRDMERALRDASNAHLLEIAESKGGEKMLMDVSGSLSPSQVKALVDSDKVTDEFRKKFGEERNRQIAARVGSDYGKANKDDLSALGPDTLADPEVAVNLSEKQIDGLDFTNGDKDNIKRVREQGLIDIIKNGKVVGGLDTSKILAKKPDFIAELPKDALVTPSFAQELPVAALEQIYHKVDKETQRKIRVELETVAHGATSARQAALYDFLEYDRIGKNFGK